MARRAPTDRSVAHLPQDKVRIKSGEYAGHRGVIGDRVGADIGVILDGEGPAVLVSPDSLQNYSLAARKAWKTNPKREGIGGRKPKSGRPRLPVAFRVDPLVWDLLKEAEKRGLISNRTEAINRWILAGVTSLLRDVAIVQADQPEDPSMATHEATIVPFASKGR